MTLHDLSSLQPHGLAETCRVVGGGIPLWHYHRARLQRGGCPPGLLCEVEAWALAEAAGWAESRSKRIRLGVTVHADATAEVKAAVHLSSLDVPNGPIAVPVPLADVAATTGDSAPPLPVGAAKSADRSWWDAAQRLAKQLGGHQAVIVGEDGLVADGGTATVWIVEGGRIATPPAPHAVAGVARAFVLDAVANGAIDASSGIAADMEPVSWQRFEAADEAFLTNAFAGAVPIRGRGGPIFARVRSLFARLGFTSSDGERLLH